MKEFKNRVALITGAGNGFGKEFAKEACRRGMKLVLVDIDEHDLKKTLDEILAQGATACACVADVSLEKDVERMVKAAMEAYGQIDLLINDAGIVIAGSVTGIPSRDWEWIVGVNCMSHVYAMKHVIPIMKAQGTPCHIVNVASIAGLITLGDMSPYYATKHFSVALSESVNYDLLKSGANIGISVFCPSFVRTDLYHCERHRPVRFQAPDDPYYTSEIYRYILSEEERMISNGAPLAPFGPYVFKAIEKGKFYIEPHKDGNLLIRHRTRNLIKGRNPDFRVVAAAMEAYTGKMSFKKAVDFMLHY